MSRFRSTALWLEPLGFFVLALLVRALPFPSLIGRGGGTLFFGNDAYYHARRVGYSVAHFPAVLERDPYMNFPYGGEPIWPPVLDWLVAAWVRGWVGPNDPVAMERILAWIPPVVGALTVVGLYCLGRWAFSRAVALVAAFALALLPAHFWYSQVGFFDHHVVTACITLALLAAAMRFLAWPADSSVGQPRGSLALLGLALAGVLLIWPGSLLHVAIVEAGLLVRMTTSASKPEAMAWGTRIAWANVIALILVAPFCVGNEWAQWGPFSPLVLTLFQPLFFGLAALCFALLTMLWRVRSMPGSVWLCAGQALALGASVGLLAVLLIPGLDEGLTLAWEWLSKGEKFQSRVQESRALFSDGLARPERFLTRLFYATPFLLLVVVIQIRDLKNSAPQLLFVGWTAVLGIMTLVQFRFVNSFSVAFALLLGASLVPLCHGLARSLVSQRIFRALAWVVLALAVVYAVQPAFAMYAPHIGNLRSLASGERTRPTYIARLQAVREDLAFWLRAHSPETRGWLDAEATPQYAVLAPWSMGHVLRYRAQRPVLQDNFGDDVAPENFARVLQFFEETDEEAALELFEGVPVRYVVVRDPEREGIQRKKALTMETRLFRYRGSGKWVLDKDRGDPPLHVPALARHRLVFESVPFRGQPGEKNPVYRVYEIVAGAQLVGRAGSDEAVVVSVPVELERGVSFEYQARTRADRSGAWSIRVPYATDRHYTVRSSSGEVRVEVSDQAVRSGDRVVVPSL